MQLKVKCSMQFVYWGFTSKQHWRSCRDGYTLVIVYIHDNFTVLRFRGRPYHWHKDPMHNPMQSHYPDTVPYSHFPILLMLSTKLISEKYQLYKSLPFCKLRIKLLTYTTIILHSSWFSHHARVQERVGRYDKGRLIIVFR